MTQPIASPLPQPEARPQPRYLAPGKPRVLMADELDDFVARIDSFGGLGSPGSNAIVADLAYVPTLAVDTSLDPFSPEYFAQQLALYHEIAGRPLDQWVNEDTPFELERHIGAPNSYDHSDPPLLADHWLRLAAALRLAAPPRGHWLLDMGCGWGLSSEFMAQSGLNVLAMDVNANFVELVNRRAARLGLNIQAARGEFESYGPPHPVDIIFFYECLHHAPRPWFVLSRLVTALSRHSNAAILLAGEPIQDYWWPNWGLRLDSGSVYVMRKYGWFESGWSMAFILRCLAAAGVEPRLGRADEGSDVIAAGNVTGLGLSWLERLAEAEGFVPTGGTGSGMAPEASIRFGTLPYPASLALRTHHSGTDPFVLLAGGTPHIVMPGPGRIDLGTIKPHDVLEFSSGHGVSIAAFEWICHFQ